MNKTYLALAYYATAGEGMSEQETRQKVKEAIKRAFATCNIKNTEPIYEPNYDDDVNNSTLLPTINENIDNNKTQIPDKTTRLENRSSEHVEQLKHQ